MKKYVFIFVIIGLVIFVIFASICIMKRGAKRAEAFVAFVIDDWGYNQKYIDLLLQIDRPLTLAVLPNLRYSGYVAKAVKENGGLHDVILHLPLESKNGNALEQDTIKSGMQKADILSILEKDLESIPGIIGVSNHQGSKVTEDKKVMRIILTELKNRGLFFLDSRTTPKSVVSNVAREIGIRHAVRDVFLDLADNIKESDFESYTRRQIEKLAAVAIQKKRAIGIGHNKMNTLKAIKDSIPYLEKQGIEIVPLKELVK